MENFNKLVYPDLSYKVYGVLFAAHNERGRFCNEKQYADAIEQKLKELKIGYVRELVIPESFEGEKLGRNKIDFLIDNKIVLEIKAVRILTKDFYYQTRRYLTACSKKLGILVNFRDRYLHPKRILNSAIRNS